ncbi:piggyBac transposable element-derived protein 4-like [Acipenser ruthenus]|uniref:piggyBac transposable element-derived protein 4-like n=1 Tax=Acipenser ruthenus TaxID=7906 RepID=UPI0027412ECA|nr:piggyBac transposable element-derived protein 4-like [Acipenser ruthenus]
MSSSVPKHPKQSRFSLSEVLEEMDRSESDGENDQLSGLESADSVSEAAFEDGLDPLQDFEDTEENPPPSTSESFDVSQQKRRRSIPTPLPYTTSSKPARPVESRRASTPTPTTSDPEERWKFVTEDDVEPVQHRFCPARAPGAQLDTSKKYSPLDLFQLYFSMNVVQSLCTNTNKNGEKQQAQGKKYQWDPVSIKWFLGILIFMGLLTTHTVRDYWSPRRPYGIPFCHTVMSRKRYEAIAWTLHISDPEEDNENDQKKGTPQHDRLFRLRPLLDSLLLSCKTYYHPRQNLSIDERMVASKARIGFKQYMKAKPTKWGFKLFVLADAHNGYTCDFNIYTGKSKSVSGKGLSYDSVMNLIKVSYLGTGYHLYVDNFYTSTTLFQDLYKLKFGACGTIRENRQGFPRTKENAIPKKADRGTIRWIRSDKLLYTKWMDTREVTMCSSIHKVYTGDKVQRRVRNEDGSWRTRNIPVPTPVKAYNQHMGGVDLSDALIKYYNMAQKTKKWYKNIFYNFIDIAVVNSFMLHKELAQAQTTKALSHKTFREELCKQLVDIGLVEQEASASTDKLCVPVAITKGKELDPSMKASFGRRHCALCNEGKLRNKTPWKCEACDVPLCVIVDRNCFKKWHMRKEKKT